MDSNEPARPAKRKRLNFACNHCKFSKSHVDTSPMHLSRPVCQTSPDPPFPSPQAGPGRSAATSKSHHAAGASPRVSNAPRPTNDDPASKCAEDPPARMRSKGPDRSPAPLGNSNQCRRWPPRVWCRVAWSPSPRPQTPRQMGVLPSRSPLRHMIWSPSPQLTTPRGLRGGSPWRLGSVGATRWRS